MHFSVKKIVEGADFGFAHSHHHIHWKAVEALILLKNEDGLMEQLRIVDMDVDFFPSNIVFNRDFQMIFWNSDVLNNVHFFMFWFSLSRILLRI
jgi:hypothetical protein